jgi:very-short-patch-repair endonuclease
VIGIDRYRAWSRLRNAVADARGVLAAFADLGFEPVIEPLLDEAATGAAIGRLATDDLRTRLQPDDRLVVFFAGHGYTAVNEFADGGCVKTGYLIPVDAARDDGRRSTWLRLETWLSDIARLPARHILVILDACHSGIALDCDTRSREQGMRNADIPDPLRARRSRRVITSALDNERAMDSGPIAGQSLFTGCLIEALRGGMAARIGDSLVTGSEIGHYVRRRVRESTCEQQTPDIGTLELDDRGELLVSLPSLEAAAAPSAASTARDARVTFGPRHGPLRAPGLPPLPRRYGDSEAHRTEGWRLDAAFVAQLDRHDAERRHGGQVLSVVAGEAMAAQTAWATWAAGHGYLTLVTQAQDPGAAIADLLAQTPWLRCLPETRRRVAVAAQIDVAAVDATLDAQSAGERHRWIADLAGLDPHVQVSGWLLCALRGRSAGPPDLNRAPVKGGELLAIACDLACPTAVLVQHPSPDAAWLERAIATAAALTGYMPGHAVAVTAPDALIDRVLHGAPDCAALSMARQGRVTMAMPAERSPGRARARTARALFEALAHDPRTRDRFALHGQVASEAGPAIDVDLVASRTRIAVVLDGWYHFHDPEGYRRDRVQDVRLQRAGYFVMRFLAEDVDDRLASTVDHIAIALTGRRSPRASSEGPSP